MSQPVWGRLCGGGGLQHAPEHVPARCSDDDAEKPGKAVPSPVLALLPAIQFLSVPHFPPFDPWSLHAIAYRCSLGEIAALSEVSLSRQCMDSHHSPSNARAQDLQFFS